MTCIGLKPNDYCENEAKNGANGNTVLMVHYYSEYTTLGTV